jgi:hypothetical protein
LSAFLLTSQHFLFFWGAGAFCILHKSSITELHPQTLGFGGQGITLKLRPWTHYIVQVGLKLWILCFPVPESPRPNFFYSFLLANVNCTMGFYCDSSIDVLVYFE